MFGEILWQRWTLIKDRDGNDIIRGTWAEDGSPFFIQAPYQLIPSILSLQNALSDVYCEIEYLEGKAMNIKAMFRKMIGK